MVGLGDKHLEAVQVGVSARLCSIFDLLAGERALLVDCGFP